MNKPAKAIGVNQTVYGLDVTPATLLDRLLKLATLPIPESIFVWGDKGIGKSDIAIELASVMGIPYNIWNLSTWDTVDANGIPGIRFNEAKGYEVTRWTPPDIVPVGPTVIILEEVNTSRPELMATLYHLVLEHRLGAVSLHPESVIIALGNRDEDSAATNPLPAPLSDRFFHFHLTISVDDWCDWALGHGIPIEDIAFIRYKGLATLHNYTRGHHAFCTPRSWAKLFLALKHMHATMDERGDFAVAKVGFGAATEYMAFRSLADKLPTLADILKSPTKIPIPDEASMKYAVTCMLVANTTVTNISPVMTYLQRLGHDFVTLWVTLGGNRIEGIINTPEYNGWAIKHAHLRKGSDWA